MNRHRFSPSSLIRDWYTPGDKKSQDRLRILFSNYNAQIISYLTGGTFWTGLLVLMNADDAFVGTVSMIPALANILGWVSPLLMERFPKRKKLIMILRAVYFAILTVFVGLIPIFPIAAQGKLTTLLLAVFIANAVNAVSSPGIAAFHLPTMEEHVRPAFFSFINATSGIIGLTINLAAGAAVDLFKANGLEYEALLGLRLLALVFGILDLILYGGIREYPYPDQSNRCGIREMVLLPLREKKYRLSILAVVIYYLVANMPGSYHSIYLISDLKVDYTYLNFVSFLSVPITLLFAPVWKKAELRWGWFRTLSLALVIDPVFYIGLSLIEKQTVWIYMVSCIIHYMVAAPGISMCITGIAYYNMPEKRQSVYYAFYATMVNAANMLSIYFGKCFIGWTEGLTLNLFGVMMGNKQYICVLCALCIFAVSFIIRWIARIDSNNQQTVRSDRLPC